MFQLTGGLLLIALGAYTWVDARRIGASFGRTAAPTLVRGIAVVYVALGLIAVARWL
jgi:hypothetical protein